MNNKNRSVKIYGLKNCDSCRKALKAISLIVPDAQLIDIREQPLKKSQLVDWCQQFGFDKLLNRRSTTWRTLSAQEKKITTNSQAVALILSQPTLMKRPVITADNSAMLGVDSAELTSFVRA